MCIILFILAPSGTRQCESSLSSRSSLSASSRSRSNSPFIHSPLYFEKKYLFIIIRTISNNIHLYGTNTIIKGYNSPVNVYVWEKIVDFNGEKATTGLLVEIRNKVIQFTKLVTINEIKSVCYNNSKLYQLIIQLNILKTPDIYSLITDALKYNENPELIEQLCTTLITQLEIRDNLIYVNMPTKDYKIEK